MRSGPSIRVLLLGAHAFVWLLPLAAFSLLRIYDVYLLRQTEHQLIVESVVVGEIYREAWLRVLGRPADETAAAPSRASSVAGQRDREPYHPIEAQIDFFQPVLAREQGELPAKTSSGMPADRAGAAIEPLLRRAQTYNLSALRVLDEQGCVVATTRSETGSCMTALPEVQRALRGEYAAVLRERVSDEPPPRLGDIRRRGKVRVFTALPIFWDGKVIGVVRASRTGLDALSSLWANRRGLVASSLLALALALSVTLLFSAAIVRPLRRLTAAARAVAAGERPQKLPLTRSLPHEIAVLQEVLFQMADRLSQRATYVQDFANQVSHELKTPITAIRGAAELLAHGADEMTRVDQQRFVANIVEDAERMESLVGKLLTLARLENENLTVQVEPVDVGDQLSRLLARYDQRVELERPSQPLYARIEPERLASVVLNLVENGLRHGAGQTVRVVVARDLPQVRIDVVDRGLGVSEANRKRLFERFFTTERDRGGSGLGLAIVKAIAEAQGGGVDARFEPGTTTFSVWL